MISNSQVLKKMSDHAVYRRFVIYIILFLLIKKILVEIQTFSTTVLQYAVFGRPNVLGTLIKNVGKTNFADLF